MLFFFLPFLFVFSLVLFFLVLFIGSFFFVSFFYKFFSGLLLIFTGFFFFTGRRKAYNLTMIMTLLGMGGVGSTRKKEQAREEEKQKHG